MNEWDMAIKSLRLHGRFIAIGVFCGFIIAIILIFFQKPVWQSEMIIGPSERTSVPSMASFLPKAAAADAPALQYFVERIDASRATDFTMFETLLNSPQSVDNLLKNGGDFLPVSDRADLQIWLNKYLMIRPVGLTPYLKISLRHKDKKQGVNILSFLYDTTDQTIRQVKQLKTARRISYLNGQLKTVRNPDHRDAIIALLKEQEQIAMMAAIDNEFAADLIEPPHLLPCPVAPNAYILLPFLMFSGGIIGMMLSGFYRAIKQ